MLSIDRGSDGVVVIAGRFDAAQCPAAQSYLDRLDGPTVKLDCSRLEYISSAGLGVLLKTHKRLLACSGGLQLARLTPHLRDILRYSGMDQVLAVEPAG